MADRGFQIEENLLLSFFLIFLYLQVTPSAQTKSRMTKKEVQKTKEIKTMKSYKILKITLPITMMQHVDKIFLVCIALCNIKHVLIQTNKD